MSQTINHHRVTEVLVISSEGAWIIHGDDMFTVDGASVVVTHPECLAAVSRLFLMLLERLWR